MGNGLYTKSYKAPRPIFDTFFYRLSRFIVFKKNKTCLGDVLIQYWGWFSNFFNTYNLSRSYFDPKYILCVNLIKINYV